MNWMLCTVLCVLAGTLGWIGWELRAVRKTLQARWDYDRINKIFALLPENLANHRDYSVSIRQLLQRPYQLSHTFPIPRE